MKKRPPPLPPYNFTDKTVLIILITNLHNVWRIWNLRYCYIELPKIEENHTLFVQ